MTRLHFSSALLLCLVLGAVGCAGGGDGTEVHGDLVVGLADYDTGFVFDRPVRLPAPRTTPPTPGQTVGECVVNEDGARLLLERDLVPEDDRGLSSFELRLPAEGVASARAVVGGVAHLAEAGTECELEAMYADAKDGALGVSAACTMWSEGGEVAIATAELHFTGCRLE